MKQLKKTLFEVAPWAQGLECESPAAIAVRDWWDSAQRVYPTNTQRAWRADWHVYEGFCRDHGVETVPATPVTVAAFVNAGAEAGKKPATIRRYLTTVALAHRVARFDSPCTSAAVRHALKGLTNEVSTRQRQARGIGWAEIQKFLETAGEGLPATRERALLCVAYDTMARRGELVAFNRGDIKFLEDGSGRALIRRSKTDQAGEGHTAYLAPVTVRCLNEWLVLAQITKGAVFEAAHRDWVPAQETAAAGKGAEVKDHLGADRGAPECGGGGEYLQERRQTYQDGAGGHPGHQRATRSASGRRRICLALNIDLASVMQAGRWKSHRMPMRYGEHVMAGLGGMARAAKAQGRAVEWSTADIWIVALFGVAAGGLLCWLLMRTRLSSAVAAALHPLQLEAAAAQERIRGLEEERVTASRGITDLRLALDQSRNDAAALKERADQVPRLTEELTGLRSALLSANTERASFEAEAKQASALTAQLEEARTSISDLNKRLGDLNADLAAARRDIEAERRVAPDKLALLAGAQETLANQFKSLANDILEDKSKRFTEQNQLNIGQLLDPLRLKITEFQTKVEQGYVQEGKDRSALAEQVRQLMELNNRLSDEANNLTKALKGSSKTQGNWGELISNAFLRPRGYERTKSTWSKEVTRATMDRGLNPTLSFDYLKIET